MHGIDTDYTLIALCALSHVSRTFRCGADPSARAQCSSGTQQRSQCVECVDMSGHPDVRSPRPFPFLKSYPVHLQHADSPEPQPLAGYVVGTVNGQRIILGGISATVLAPGEAVIVRMAVGSEVLGFHTLVAEACGTDMPLYLLEMPET